MHQRKLVPELVLGLAPVPIRHQVPGIGDTQLMSLMDLGNWRKTIKQEHGASAEQPGPAPISGHDAVVGLAVTPTAAAVRLANGTCHGCCGTCRVANTTLGPADQTTPSPVSGLREARI